MAEGGGGGGIKQIDLMEATYVELCAATLQDYIEGRYVTDKLDLTAVFR